MKQCLLMQTIYTLLICLYNISAVLYKSKVNKADQEEVLYKLLLSSLQSKRWIEKEGKQKTRSLKL